MVRLTIRAFAWGAKMYKSPIHFGAPTTQKHVYSRLAIYFYDDNESVITQHTVTDACSQPGFSCLLFLRSAVNQSTLSSHSNVKTNPAIFNHFKRDLNLKYSFRGNYFFT